MLNTRTQEMSLVRHEHWVMWGRKGGVDFLERHLGIQHALREAARRFGRNQVVHRQIYPAFGKKE